MLLRFFHIALALLLFASSAGANLSIHYCGGEIAKWALFIKSGDCGMPHPAKQAQASESDNNTAQINRTPCCQDELSYHKLDVEQPTQDASGAKTVKSETFAATELTPALALSQRPSFPFSSPIVRPPPNPLQLLRRLAQLNVRRI